MDRASSELVAMQAIASALSAIPEGASRNRVLRWASEHFNTELVPTVVTSMSTTARREVQAADIDAIDAVDVVDQRVDLPAHACSLNEPCDPENLDSLFEETRSAALMVPAGRARPQKSVVSSLESFVADFKKLAQDWQNA